MENLKEEKLATVLGVRTLTASAFVLRFERSELAFQAGQYVKLGIPDQPERREYSIYSPVTASYLEILVQLVDTASFSFRLKQLRSGDHLWVSGPYGSFNLEDNYANDENIFIASGTGISPFHCMVLSYPRLHYTLLHGVRNLNEGYDRTIYRNGQYIQCTTSESGSEFYGRVTDYLRKHKPDSKAHYYLCGNRAMINEVRDLLMAADVPAINMHVEIYF
ncbi:MAG: FAD-binding oxidoreductase [Bacteroidota bacterium]|nr:FAD-binding oxidoreductase [Bacteroidota bacterium]